jgi:hypothetical protein
MWRISARRARTQREPCRPDVTPPMGLAAGLATLRALEEERLIAPRRNPGPRQSRARYDVVREVRG